VKFAEEQSATLQSQKNDLYQQTPQIKQLTGYSSVQVKPTRFGIETIVA